MSLAYLSLLYDAKAAGTGLRVVCVEKEPSALLVDLAFVKMRECEAAVWTMASESTLHVL